MKDVQKKIIDLRNELREDYDRLCKKYWKVFLEIDSYFENLSKALENKELKGGN